MERKEIIGARGEEGKKEGEMVRDGLRQDTTSLLTTIWHRAVWDQHGS